MIYLDNGATSFPKPKGMLMAMNECISTYCGNPGRSGHSMSMRTGEEVFKARRAVGELFGIKDYSRILFTLNTTGALNLGIKGVLEPGDHVVTTSMEHNSVLRPLRALENQGIETTIVKCGMDGSLDINSIKNVIKENTKLIVCTHASNVTGTIMPIKELGAFARKKKILFMVDGAQSAGSVPIDVDSMNIDLLALPGHKGLLGPLGTGLLYVREGVNVKTLIEGGTGTNSKDLIQPWEYPEGYESGTVNAPGIIGLGYSCKYVKKMGIQNIKNYEDELIEILDGSLRNMQGITVYGPWDCRKKTGIVTFNINHLSCEDVCDKLNGYGIASRGGFHCAGLAHKTIGTYDTGAIRLSVGPFNTKKDIQTAVRAIYQIKKV
ncbi:aminotransferase class V-fold PLP-dependent enzyme [Sinanaerobacter chloroacetimidivorans]|jgi:cysteine desulfurase/selenocysteine lyase|uniref:cysteine desulfurase n=1 Tax=Sinanaerobacter chloroacetimidivorans TaxID=2818044 RepID=A0A8J7VZR0_9FIRM|nr:aminotransferase class V-fold PLP-dependent enzyme [Sinanaerobacter chloroacetimidivorans]MBR0597696.1 aminotransferase class V-fold PLP-dependent enzyme [Sinanaerobacter chloroacetimidivorans]